jgi:hypothetical protein
VCVCGGGGVGGIQHASELVSSSSEGSLMCIVWFTVLWRLLFPPDFLECHNTGSEPGHKVVIQWAMMTYVIHRG